MSAWVHDWQVYLDAQTVTWGQIVGPCFALAINLLLICLFRALGAFASCSECGLPSCSRCREEAISGLVFKWYREKKEKR